MLYFNKQLIDQIMIINPYPAKVIYLGFQPLEVVSRYRDPQPEVVEIFHFKIVKKILQYSKMTLIPK